MLPSTATDALAPGTNLRDHGRGDSWVLWLPDLEVGRAVALGRIPTSIRRHLRRAAGRFDELPGHATPEDGEPASVVVVERRVLAHLVRDDARLRALRAAAASAVLVVVGRRAASDRTLTRVAQLMETPVRPGDRTALLPRPSGPSAHDGTRRALAVPSLRAPAAHARPVRVARSAVHVAKRRLRRDGVAVAASGRHPSDLAPLVPTPTGGHRAARLLVLDPAAGAPDAPPAWLRRLLAAGGITDPLVVWAFAAPRGYRSQKTIFLLAAPDHEPHLVVKVTQEPRFNHRLEAEVDALRRIESDRIVPPGTVPRVVHADTYAGLAVAVETRCEGTAFREVGPASPGAPHVAAMTTWLADLARRTACPDRRPAPERRTELQRLVDRYVELDRPPPADRRRLRALADDVAAADVPTVFFHGDPGAWNLLVGADGRPAVLDWENAHPHGPPLWDLLLFQRSVEQLVDEQAGRRHTAALHVERHMGDDPEWDPARRSVQAMARDLGITVDAAHGITVLCWVHHSLRHATRRPSDAPAPAWHREVVSRLLHAAGPVP